MAYEYGPPSRPLGEILTALQRCLAREYRAEYLPSHRRSPRRSRRLRRIRGWSREIDHLALQIGRVMRQTVPRIERETGHTFRSPDRLVRILTDPSVKRLFRDILAGLPEEALPAPAWDLALLGNISDDARVAAIIGDVTLQLKVPPGAHLRPADLVALCDRWGLHEDRIGLLCRPCRNGETLAQEKESLACAVLGFIYVEGGSDALGHAASFLA